MLEKLLVLIFQSKSLVLTGVLAGGVLVTGTFGGQAVNLVITPLGVPPLAYPADPLVQIEAPKLGAWINGTVEVKGWALDRNNEEGTGIERVSVYLDGIADDKKLGDATYGAERKDVAQLLGDDDFTMSGWSFSWVAGTLEGNHTLYVLVKAKGGRAALATREVNDPLVRFDVPVAGARVRQNDLVDIGGWAIDRSDDEFDGIESVTLYLDARDDAHRLGVASLGVESPDIAEEYGERFAEAGWTFLWDTGETAIGEHVLYAVARSSVSGHETVASREIVVLEDEDLASGPGCSDWAHQRNAAWHEVHGNWQAFRAELQGLQAQAKGPKKGAKSQVHAAVRGARSTIDATVKSAHREIQALAHSHKCQHGPAMTAAYAEIVNRASTEMARAVASGERAALAALAAATSDRGKPNDKGRP